jgi:hypothetical protein
VDLSEMRRILPRWSRGRRKSWESDFTVIVPAELPEWISTLRFEVKQVDRPPYYPFRLDPAKQRSMLMRMFDVGRWRAVERMLPIHRYGRLQQVRDGRILAAFSLWEEETFIGRDYLKCTVVVPQQYTKVSRIHAVIRREAEGIVLEDLDSHNGTFLEGRPVDGKTLLKEGAVISLGGRGASEKEATFHFHAIEDSHEDAETTEDGTHPQTPLIR